jgi:hypothetical protein
MADDFLGIPTDAAADVPAEIQSDGAVTENNTGEQVADEAGNASWWDSNYPGQTTTSADSPTQDAYGLNILSAAETQQLTRNINPAFINNFTDPNVAQPVVINRLNGRPIESPVPYGNLTPDQQAKRDARLAEEEANRVQNLDPNYWANKRQPSAQPAYVDQSGLAFDSRTGVTYPVDKASGKQLIPANVLAVTDSAAQVRIEMFGAGAKSVPTPVNTGAGVAVAAANQQTAAAAARLNAQSPNPYLTNIDQAAAEISRGQDGITTANQTIQSAQQKIADSESIIARQNAELADPTISAERRAVLEANNAAQVQNVFDQTQSINENQDYITTTQETIQLNEASIDANSAGYRATTAGSNVPVVEVNSDPSFVGPQQITATVINPTTNAAAVNPIDTGYTSDAEQIALGRLLQSANDAVADEAAQVEVGRQLAQQQAVNAAQKKIANNGDWRVRLSLAPGARYLYNVDGDPGILQPLAVTGGVIFPYTPRIEMSYKADYESYALTHSNYRGYFYKSSSVDPVNMTATFTAQDSAEANYLLAVIHFFRSVTKMFYGKDAQRGAPPPLVYLTGLGQYQFNGHPCVVTSFNYNLPSDVDYIRARSPNINGTNMLTRRDKQDLPTNPISGAVARLQNLFSGQGISYGAEICRPPPPTLGLNNPTYVPTKLDITLTLLPMQTRSQVTNQFSLQQYATGALLGGSPGTSGKGGFW